MKLNVEVLDCASAERQLAEQWDRLLARNVLPPAGLDATAGPVWFGAVSEAFGTAARSKVVTLREGDALVSVLPVVSEPGGWFCRRLFAPTLLYGGRNGFVLREPSVETLHATLSALTCAFGRWQSMRLTLVEGGEGEALLALACARYGYRTVSDGGEPSPHFPLLADSAAFSAKMSKGLKQTLRTAANKFKALGSLEYRELGAEAEVEWAIEAILAIDRASWKQEAGTAITCHPEQERFYRALLPRAARAGMLQGQIALLNGQPIAFNFGIAQSGVFCCLKHSQTHEHQTLSPGQLLNAELIARLRERGVGVYDYMGKVEAHKMRWSDANGLYTCRQVWIYPPTFCGRVGYLVHELKRQAARWLKRDRPTAAAPEVGG